MKRISIVPFTLISAMLLTTFTTLADSWAGFTVKLPPKKGSTGSSNVPSKDDGLTLHYSEGKLHFTPDAEIYSDGNCKCILYNIDNNTLYKYNYTLPIEDIYIDVPEVPATYVINVELNNQGYAATYYLTK